MHLTIKSRNHDYKVTESASLEKSLLEIATYPYCYFIIDKNFYQIYKKCFDKIVPLKNIYLITPTETNKSYVKIAKVFQWLLKAGIKRKSRLIVIGGGILEDIGCFIASVIFRGIEWTFIPTTLLAQCDSCIGSKSSINLAGYKNQIGTFYPPNQIYLITSLISTLSQQALYSGIGEIIKLHLIDGQKSVNFLESNLPDFIVCPKTQKKIIFRCLNIKKIYIEEDEFDQGIRNILNYGHTFAHAYEVVSNYEIPHGIAVSMGICSATFFSEKLNMLKVGYSKHLREWMFPYYNGYQDQLLTVTAKNIANKMKQDKKNTDSRITLILTRGAGSMEKVSLDYEKMIKLLPMAIDYLQ